MISSFLSFKSFLTISILFSLYLISLLPVQATLSIQDQKEISQDNITKIGTLSFFPLRLLQDEILPKLDAKTMHRLMASNRTLYFLFTGYDLNDHESKISSHPLPKGLQHPKKKPILKLIGYNRTLDFRKKIQDINEITSHTLYYDFVEIAHPSLYLLPYLKGTNIITLDLKEVPTTAGYVRSDFETLALNTFPFITSLNLLYCHLRDVDVQILTKNKSLTFVNLTHNSVRDEGAEALAKNTTLKSLKLYFNPIENSAKQIFKDNTTLIFFDLWKKDS